MDNESTNAERAAKTKKDLETIFPNKKLLILAVSDIDFENPGEKPQESVDSFAMSTVTSTSDILQIALLLSRDEDLCNLLSDALKLKERLLEDSKISGLLDNIMKKTED